MDPAIIPKGVAITVITPFVGSYLYLSKTYRSADGTDVHVRDPVRDIMQLTSVSTATIPQDAFPDPTLLVTYSKMTSAFDKTPPASGVLSWFPENEKMESMPYDPFYLGLSMG